MPKCGRVGERYEISAASTICTSTIAGTCQTRQHTANTPQIPDIEAAGVRPEAMHVWVSSCQRRGKNGGGPQRKSSYSSPLSSLDGAGRTLEALVGGAPKWFLSPPLEAECVSDANQPVMRTTKAGEAAYVLSNLRNRIIETILIRGVHKCYTPALPDVFCIAEASSWPVLILIIKAI
jgi:hypothetical protein